jgi:DNA-binding PadR family transcriptional regulator
MPRRKPGALLPLELEILATALSLMRTGQPVFHGFALAQDMRERAGSRSLTGHGTLYKALGRLERRGLLSSSWEDASAAEGRPRRRLYRLTDQGAAAAAGAHGEPVPVKTPLLHRVAPRSA